MLTAIDSLLHDVRRQFGHSINVRRMQQKFAFIFVVFGERSVAKSHNAHFLSDFCVGALRL